MNNHERGSEVVQAVIALPLVLAVVFAIFQVGAMMLSVNRLTADMARACRQMDTAGLALALDKEAFVKSELLGAATQLDEELLCVTQVSLLSHEAELASKAAPLKDESQSGGGLLAEQWGGAPSLSQRTQVSEVSFDVAYELPFLAEVPGLAHTTIARHIECSLARNRVVEVEVALL